VQLRSLREVIPLESVAVYDVDRESSRRFVDWARSDLRIDARATDSASGAVRDADVVVTCTSSDHVVLDDADVPPGAFVAAVGADNEHKWEIDPQLFPRSKVVVDNLNQCATIGDLHHAITQRTMTREAVYSDLGSIVADKKRGREREDEVTLFDSTGIALQDAVTAALVLRRARERKLGMVFDFFA
jgi:ornithine cyclodeaminase/alanine dehydrogenase-like protein (mu-crystallin family)